MPPDNGRPSVADEMAYLNERYYHLSPHIYFSQRLSGLLATAAKLDEWKSSLAAGIALADDEIIFVVNDDEHVETELTTEELEAYVTAETQILVYHAAETMFRLFLAHLDEPSCPWIALSRSPAPADFRQEIVQKFSSVRPQNDFDAELVGVVLGTSLPSKEPQNEEFFRRLANLEGLLRFLADEVLDSKELYNAAKHGLTILPSKAYLRVASTADETQFEHSAPSLEYLTHRKAGSSHREWLVNILWINLVVAWSLTFVAFEVTRSIWTVGRRRLVGPQPDDHAFLLMNLSIEAIVRDSGGLGIRTFSRGLFFERR